MYVCVCMCVPWCHIIHLLLLLIGLMKRIVSNNHIHTFRWLGGLDFLPLFKSMYTRTVAAAAAQNFSFQNEMD